MSDALPRAAAAVLLALHGAGWALLYALAIGFGLGLGVWVLFRLFADRTPWARYVLGCGAMLVLVGVPVQTGRSIRDAYVGHRETTEAYAVELMRAGSDHPVGALPGGWVPEELALAVEMRHDRDVHAWLEGDDARALGFLLALLALVWFVGAVYRLARLAKDLRVVSVLRSRAVTAPSRRWMRILAESQERLGVLSPVLLRVSPCVDGPVLVGWREPMILIPPGAHDRLADTQAEAILVHELAHVRRGDYAINVLQSIAEAVLWFHPVAWWLSEQVRDEREYCSDDLAHRAMRGTLADYLRALAALETLRGAPAPSPAVAADGRSLVRRMQRLAGLSRQQRPRFDVEVFIVAACLVGLWFPTTIATRATGHAAVAVMKHELRMAGSYGALVSAPEHTHGIHEAGPVEVDREADHD